MLSYRSTREFASTREKCWVARGAAALHLECTYKFPMSPQPIRTRIISALFYNELYRPEADKLSEKWTFARDEVEGKWETLRTIWKHWKFYLIVRTTHKRTEIFYFQKCYLIESNDRQSDRSHCSRQRPRRSVWRAEMKVAAMKLTIAEIRSQICRSDVKILTKWFIQNTTITSLLDYLGLNISWLLVSGNDCRRMIPWKLHRRRKLLFCSLTLTKTRSQWLKFRLVA